MPWIGRSVRRLEDPRFLRGDGRFVADVRRPGMLHAAVLRSPYAHARIHRLDPARARAAPGVVAVLTFGDAPELARPIPMRMSGRGIMDRFLQTPLARDKVRYVGEPIAVVVAGDRYRAEDALERIEVEYALLPALVDGRVAGEPGAPLLFEGVGTNVVAAFTTQHGDVERALREADLVVRQRIDVQRLAAVPMETRGIVVEWDAGRELLTVWGATKAPFFTRRVLAEHLGLAEHAVHVRQIDVGGAFGVRGEVYPEDVFVALLARRLGRPVRWIEDRREHLVAANHSREQHHEIALALRRDGTILGIDDRFWHNMGGYVRTHGATVPNNTAGYMSGPYRVPHYRVEATCVVTNKTPAGTYRGPGRYEANVVRERVVDIAARALGLDPAEIRRRNFVPADAMPYDVGTQTLDRKVVYDSGDFPHLFERALVRFDYAGLRAEQARARAAGRRLGIGMAYVVEKSGLGPWESARVTVDGSGHVVVDTGIPSVGQGVETAFAQLCADVLSVPYDDVKVRYGDTAQLPDAVGAFGSRGTVVGGNAVYRAATRVREKILAVAARTLEAHPNDLVLADGRVHVKGAPARGLSLREVARAAAPTPALRAGLEPGLEALDYYAQEKMTYGHGLHLALVEVDPDTGKVTLLHYFVDYDIGRAVNPMLVHGQMVGGIVQGVGAALAEELAYDDQGQPLSATLMDYALPAAGDLPSFEVVLAENDPSPVNPLGLKGAGEDGTVAAGPAVANAVADALADLGGEVTRMPLIPARVRALIAR